MKGRDKDIPEDNRAHLPRNNGNKVKLLDSKDGSNVAIRTATLKKSYPSKKVAD